MATRLYKVGTVSVTNGSNIVTGSGTNWANAADKPQAGDLFSLDLDKFYEIIATTNTQITLDRNFAGTTQSGVNYSIVRHSSAGDIQSLNLAISSLINNRESFVDSLDEVVSGDADEVTHVNRFNQSKQIPTLKKARDDYAAVQAQAESLVGSIVLPNQAEFESRHEGKYAGAGFVEWGQSFTNSGSSNVVGEGLWTLISASNPNSLFLGNSNPLTVGNSKTRYPVAYLSGCIFRVHANNEFQTNILFPTAPDGLDKADGTGRFASLSEAITAGGTSLSASVIHRQDLCGIEVFDVNITTSGLPLYPYGSCQYGSSWEGITLSDNLVDQGYSAFYVGDTVTKGRGFIPDLTNDNHVKFIQDKRNNCYRNHLGEIIQRQYRIRTIAGLEGGWGNLDFTGTSGAFTNTNILEPQGMQTTAKGLKGYTDPLFYPKGNASIKKDAELGAFHVPDTSASDSLAYDRNCWFIPIALVQRRNQGAYHPVYNVAGSAHFLNSAGDWDNPWYAQASNSGAKYNGWLPQSVSDCFIQTGEGRKVYGNISNGASKNGRPDDMFYDAIYASDVLDLRLSAHYVDYDTVNRVENAKNINATARGWEATPCVGKASDFQLKGSSDIYAENGRFLFTRPDGISGYIDTNPSVAQSLDGLCWFFADTNNGDIYKMTGWVNRFHTRVRKWNGSSWEALSSKTQLDGLDLIAIPYDGRNISDADRLDINNFFYTGYPNGAEGRYYLGTEYCVKPEHLYKIKIPYYQSEPTWTDIIADPSVLAATFPDGVGGSWLPVIPDDTSKTAKLNKKQLGVYSWLSSTNGGDTWVSNTAGNFDNISNSYAANFDGDAVGLISYKSKANFANAANIIANGLSRFSSVKSSNYHDASNGGVLAQSTIGKIPTSPYGVSYMLNHDFTRMPINSLSGSSTFNLGAHSPDVSDKLNVNTSPALKHFTRIAERNGQLYQQIIAKEIVYDAVDGFGDNNLFEVADGVATKTDLNGNTIIYGCWERPLPYWTNNKVN